MDLCRKRSTISVSSNQKIRAILVITKKINMIKQILDLAVRVDRRVEAIVADQIYKNHTKNDQLKLG